MRYAESDTGETIDLWRFETEAERDQFVSNNPGTASATLYKHAIVNHK